MEDMEMLVYAVLFGCIMVLGLCLNIVSLWILLRRHSFKSSSAVFMVNLAVSDLLLVISLPFRVYVYATNSWALGPKACISVTMLFRNNFRASSIFITFISVDRLLAVVYPLRSRHLRTVSNAWKGAAVAWLFLVLISIPEALEFNKGFKQNKTEPNQNITCFEIVQILSQQRQIPPSSYVHVVMQLFMFAVNVVCTAMVSWTLRKHFNDSARISNKVNVILIFVLNLVMFTVCFLPLSVAAITFRRIEEVRPLICIASLNCCLDPLLYYFSLDAFWKKKEETDLQREQRTRETQCL